MCAEVSVNVSGNIPFVATKAIKEIAAGVDKETALTPVKKAIEQSNSHVRFNSSLNADIYLAQMTLAGVLTQASEGLDPVTLENYRKNLGRGSGKGT